MAEVLKHPIGLGLLTAYGVGVMVGAGIHLLVGAVAVEAGAWAPLSFLLAGFVAVPTELSYAEFSARLPEAAFRVPALVPLAGLVASAAALTVTLFGGNA